MCMSGTPFSYKYRPYYFDPEKGGRGKLIEFSRGSGEEGFVNRVVDCLKTLDPVLGVPEDLWPIMDTRIKLTCSLGEVHFMMDDWGLVFLEGDNNILDQIDAILAADPDWEKLEVIERDYHLTKNKK